METEKKKFNPYIIIIIVLVIIIAGLTYNKWGKGILSPSVKSPEQSGSDIDVGTLEGDISVGNEDAPVTIVEYFSYFCGYCKLFHDETYPRIVEDYISNGRVRYVFRPFPPYELGVAVLCANDQDKFLEYHNEIFKEVENIEKADDLKTLAKNIGLEIEQFNQCFDSQKYLAKAQEWYQQANNDFEDAGIPSDQRGTPTFVVNGELLIGAQPYENFVEVIERKLGE